MQATVLIIDDEEPLRKLLGRIISLEGFTVLQAGSLKEGSTILNQHPVDVILCDVKLPDGNGVEFVKTIRERYPLCECILLTAYGHIADGVQAIKNGAFDYITKADDNDRIIPLLYQAMDHVTRKKQSLVTVRHNSLPGFEAILGSSAAIREAIQYAQKIAATDSTVLLLGETGTGKEVFANAIHTASKRTGKPLVAINCSAFPKDLLEGELFGHKAGAFTGASKDKKGLIEQADGGTLFLDEIGEMNINLQAKLLRVLENGEFIKIGDTKVTRVNVRIIAATHRQLTEMIDQGLFREDLYYRLNVFSIHLPALRTRMEDIPELSAYFLGQFAARENRPPHQLSKEALALLQHYQWKGNIRELKNVLERASVLAEGATIEASDLPFEIQQNTGADTGLTLASVEKSHIRKVLLYTRGNKTRAAEWLGIGLTTLYRKLEEYQIKS